MTTRSKLGTVEQIEMARRVLARLSEERVSNKTLRDAIGIVRYELGDELDRIEDSE